ncbi:MAG TPA: hypothetical protein VM182_10175 [Terriglobia bacterium]|nr:hypothetical protein [Terriglobia bacterium]
MAGEAEPTFFSYYRRFIGQVWKRVWPFTWTRVILAMAYVIAALALQIHYGMIPRELAWRSFGIASLPYIAFLVVALAWFAVNSPVELDRERGAQIKRLHDENTVLRKKPYESHLEQRVKQGLGAVTNEGRGLLGYLLPIGEIAEKNIVIHGMTSESIWQAIVSCKGAGLVIQRDEGPAGIPTRYVSIPGEFKPVLRDLLFPQDSATQI